MYQCKSVVEAQKQQKKIIAFTIKFDFRPADKVSGTDFSLLGLIIKPDGGKEIIFHKSFDIKQLVIWAIGVAMKSVP